MTGPFPPTHRQMQLLRFITGYLEAHSGVGPTLIECAQAVGYRSKSNVYGLLSGLERRGLIHRLPQRQRAIEVLHPVSIPRAPDGAPLHLVTLPTLENRP